MANFLSVNGQRLNAGSSFLAASVPTVSAPTNSVAPAITGTTTEGQTLTCSTGTWANTPTSYAYQWKRATSSGGSYSNVSGATSSTYVLQTGDATYYFKCDVTASNAGGSNTATTAASAQISAGGSQTLLQASDFTYLGYYDLHTDGNDTTYAKGLAVRKVSGSVRLMYRHYLGDLVEVSLAGHSYGDEISTTSNSWSGLPDEAQLFNFWWDEPNSRLWQLSSPSYFSYKVPTDISTFTLGASTVTLTNDVALFGVGSKRAYGGVVAVPSALQTSLSIGPYVVGLGGYTSLLAAGDGANMGPGLYAIPEPSSYSTTPKTGSKTYDPPSLADGGTTSTTVNVTGALVGEVADAPTLTTSVYGMTIYGECLSAGVVTVNFLNQTGGTIDMGSGTLAVSIPSHIPAANFTKLAETGPSVRGRTLSVTTIYTDTSPPQSSFDGSNRPNTAPSSPEWNGADGQGYGYWTWGAKYGGGFWIDSATKKGLVLIGYFATGYSWYFSSDIYADGLQTEVHVYDPTSLTGGTAVKPTNLFALSQMTVASQQNGLGDSFKNFAAFEPIDSRLYIAAPGRGSDVFRIRVYVYGVAT